MTGGLQPLPQALEEEAGIAEKQKVIFVLEQANLEVGKVGKARIYMLRIPRPFTKQPIDTTFAVSNPCTATAR